MIQVGRSIAIVSFLPDAGHVMPLLRVAAVFSERGYDITCYLPQECAHYLNGYDFAFVSLGRVINDTIRADYEEVLAKLSRRSVFYNAFSVYADLSVCYLDPLVFGVSQQITLAQVRTGLIRQQPLFFLTDDHIFRSLYINLSKELAIPLVIHSSEGYRRYQDPFVQFYGISNLARPVQALVEKLGAASENAFRLLRRMRKATSLERLHTKAVMALRQSDTDRDNACAVVISTGCGYFEQRYLSSRLRICDDLRVFGPLCRIRSSELSTELRKWLQADQGAVVYVSFGSMIHLDGGFVGAVLDGLTQLNVRVLWSMPEFQQDELLAQLDVPESVCFCDFVPPLEVLAMTNVRCGINHGGAGSIQDCLSSGIPMLCIPFMWDQPFNSSVVAGLKVGKRLWKRSVSAKAIAATVGAILSDGRIAVRAAELAEQLQHSGSEAGVVDYILGQPSIRDRQLAKV
jgi:UDP:flavonoid glycosyltransferase YjiC (YdhE family)